MEKIYYCENKRVASLYNHAKWMILEYFYTWFGNVQRSIKMEKCKSQSIKVKPIEILNGHQFQFKCRAGRYVASIIKHVQ